MSTKVEMNRKSYKNRARSKWRSREDTNGQKWILAYQNGWERSWERDWKRLKTWRNCLGTERCNIDVNCLDELVVRRLSQILKIWIRFGWTLAWIWKVNLERELGEKTFVEVFVAFFCWFWRWIWKRWKDVRAANRENHPKLTRN